VTPDRLRQCLAALAWSQRGLAELIDVDERQVRRWAAGAVIPPRIAAWVEMLARFHEQNPPPMPEDRR
jgi:ribosome-binding protein aMBF1 (putative translation factor)